MKYLNHLPIIFICFQMKFAIALMALVGVCLTAPSITLESDLLDFLELIPLEDIKIIVEKHLRSDKEFQAAIQYLQSDEFLQIMVNLDQTEQALEVKTYLLNAGIDVEFIAQLLEELIGEVVIKSHHNKASVRKVLEEVHAIIPWQELLKLYTEKITTSTSFQDFVDKLTSERFHKLIENLLSTPEAQKVLDGLEGIELHSRKHIKTVYAFVGWEASKFV